jgi:hypothetical protein
MEVLMWNEEDWFDKEPKGIWVGFGEGVCVEDARPKMSTEGF